MNSALVVDDSEPVRLVVAETLRLAGYRAYEAASVAEAFEILASASISVVISDLNLEGETSGVEFLNQALLLNPRLTCILMSGSITPDQRLRTRYPVLSKPFSPEVLFELISGLV